MWDRSRVDEAQTRAGRDTKGTTVLIHDQRCAAEKRRDRTRGLHRPAGLPGRHQRAHLRGLRRLRRQVELPLGAAGRHAVRTQDDDPPDELQLRLLVHARRLPVVRHRHGRRRRRRHAASRRPAPSHPTPTSLPGPGAGRRSATASRCGCPGIGGTGVITVSQIIGTAAMLDGLRGPRPRPDRAVAEGRSRSPATSGCHAARPPPRTTPTPPASTAMLAFDMLAAASDSHREGAVPGRTVVIGSLEVVPTGRMVTHPDEHLLPATPARCGPGSTTCRARGSTATSTPPRSAAACSAARTAANVLTLGVAVQAGALPIDPGQHRAGDRAQRRRRAAEHRRLPVRPPVGGRPDHDRVGGPARGAHAGDTRPADRSASRPTSPTTRTPTTPSASATRSTRCAAPSSASRQARRR